MAWNLTAQLIESCSCNMPCPCWLGVQELQVMDQGYCASPLLFRIQQGNAGRQMTMQNLGLTTGLQFEQETAQLAPGSSRWYGPDMPRSFETKSGVRGICQWNVN